MSIHKTSRGWKDDETGMEVYDDNFMDRYCDIFDESGNSYPCPNLGCDGAWKWRPEDDMFVCITCDTEMTRDEYLRYIDAELPGPECKTCDSPYPDCLTCPYGYKEEF